ncbi:MAG: LPS export ABC transporter periplasmic protein LptC [Massilibacteroides sp.]|nr:LPS export ABC transporter periplasmic protein LptC [Massilibacteroides sp.]MDD4660631.1 LPS export ABC transporter periplasmic protein LptC [Massilibacteroides sp.]
MRFLSITGDKISITTVFLMVVMLVLFLLSCEKEKAEVIEVAFNPDSTYTMRTTDVSELVSDSGVVRYRIIAKEWLVYDKASEPYWLFPKGGYVEKFDSLLNKDASIKADTAYYYYKKELWKLIGNVEVSNLKGEHFETELLFWDQKKERVYSDKYIRIEQEDKIITGIGFESNQDMTKYDVFNSQGVFPVKEPNDSISLPSDSITMENKHLSDSIGLKKKNKKQ